ncbi:hypothetical protein SCHPADRAFT_896487 [Schizopora paradoxa]|uniref:Uncharacterized protein n=1 Tax=Schizopora paradoxa TaxID=27342 RepID=A0A0H2R1D9_9AGAM|nr:hypothetical protein SCHPADRAFT_896487 [Schizopora paradoxa]
MFHAHSPACPASIRPVKGLGRVWMGDARLQHACPDFDVKDASWHTASSLLQKREDATSAAGLGKTSSGDGRRRWQRHAWRGLITKRDNGDVARALSGAGRMGGIDDKGRRKDGSYKTQESLQSSSQPPPSHLPSSFLLNHHHNMPACITPNFESHQIQTPSITTPMFPGLRERLSERARALDEERRQCGCAAVGEGSWQREGQGWNGEDGSRTGDGSSSNNSKATARLNNGKQLIKCQPPKGGGEARGRKTRMSVVEDEDTDMDVQAGRQMMYVPHLSLVLYLTSPHIIHHPPHAIHASSNSPKLKYENER